MMDFQRESYSYQVEVEQEAARLVRDGLAAPYDAIDHARRIVQKRRQREAAERQAAEFHKAIGR